MDFNPAGVSALLSKQSIEQFKQFLANPEIRKQVQTSNGPQAFDLEAEVKSLFPVNTPLRNVIPRYFSKEKGDVQTHWQAVTAINTGSMPMVVAEGMRAGAVSSTYVSRTAKYATLGLEDSVTEEARLAAQSYDDIDQRTVANLIWSAMIGEELQLLGGNNSFPLGTTPTPALTAAGTGSSLTAVATFVKCVAVTLEGYNRAQGNAGMPVPSVSRTVVGSSLSAGAVSQTVPGGVAQVSAEATITPTAGQFISASVTAVTGAVAYYWFVGTTTNQEHLFGVTTINSALIGSVPTGTAATLVTVLPAADNSSYNTGSPAIIGIDGIIPTIAQAGLGGVLSTLATGTPGTGTKLTSTATTIDQIDTVLLQMWNANQVGPDTIWVNAQEMTNISNKLMAAGANAQIRYAMDAGQRSADMMTISAGVVVGYYLNRFGIGGPQILPIKLHPYVPPGTIVMTAQKLPFPNSNVPSVFRVRGQLDYHEIAWQPVTRAAEYGVYMRETLQVYFPPILGMVTNIANG